MTDVERWTANPYYNPEKCGLTLIGTTEREPDWDFDILAVWRDTATGHVYWAADAGCSCPSPFEDIYALGDMIPLTKATMTEFLNALRDRRSDEPTDKVRLMLRTIAAVTR